jgi:hypothetical protein
MAESKSVWVCPFTGEELETSDPRLIGSGYPPSSPNTPIGAGLIPMTMKRVEVAATKTETTKTK